MAVLLVLIVVAGCVIVVGALVSMGRLAIDAARARTAADAAALAGVTGGRTAAERLAAEHDAVLVEWSSTGGTAVTVRVTVRVGRAHASAAASNEPAPVGIAAMRHDEPPGSPRSWCLHSQCGRPPR